uniref:Uncharacterized protein n=1 Tax=Sinocyclocheilus grahami TaxID=75366 RepID=A0A672QVN6_SINGR
MYRAREKVPCLDVSHEKLVLELRNTTATSSYRQWFYQTCTEFGFYQTCEDTSCPFSRMSTIQSQTELCSRIFDIPQEHLPVHIDFTNQYYGGNRPQTQRVLYVNGKHGICNEIVQILLFYNPVLYLLCWFMEQIRRVRTLAAPSHVCQPSSLRLSSALESLTSLRNICLSTLTLPTSTMEGTGPKHKECSMSMVSTLLKIKVLHDAIEEPFCLNGSIKNL